MDTTPPARWCRWISAPSVQVSCRQGIAELFQYSFISRIEIDKKRICFAQAEPGWARTAPCAANYVRTRRSKAAVCACACDYKKRGADLIPRPVFAGVAKFQRKRLSRSLNGASRRHLDVNLRSHRHLHLDHGHPRDVHADPGTNHGSRDCFDRNRSEGERSHPEMCCLGRDLGLHLSFDAFTIGLQPGQLAFFAS